MSEPLTVAWFSSGVSSAVATKLAIEEIDHIFYIHIEDQHFDTLRFVRDCEEWFDMPIKILQSPLESVETACYSAGGRGYVNGPSGAACTRLLKKQVRKQWEVENMNSSLRYVWGMDREEESRCEGLLESMPEYEHIFPLIEKGVDKEEAHKILSASGIKRPALYDLGYNNNNCVGCVKGGMGYWNHIRVDFPEVFRRRAIMERNIKATCIKGVYLDELDPERGRHTPPVVDDCGVLCEAIAL
ncbi:phosphoadenosine phosphosulfate reductase family protein [Candidatus Pacearchaeota archaeon]|nr:phosphoadenosine phosphosulfate reductase family protein [Candidatus Pacearchaeota archaeon]